MIKIAIDAMGGDYGPPIIVPAAIATLAKYPNLQLILVGDEAILLKELEKHTLSPRARRGVGTFDSIPQQVRDDNQQVRDDTYDKTRLSIHHASQRVEMDESPAQALRSKKDSSMRIAINLVKEGGAQACVSAGNTGALMATARFVLKTLPGIDRPAIISTFPTIKSKNVRILDLGANVDSSAENLMQFAVMGSVLVSAIDHIPNPKVYLLNIGEEEIKGNEQVKQTAQILSQLSLINYSGYIEGDMLYRGEADVVVCDGFVGNVALKTTEGVAILIRQLMREAFMRNWLTRLGGYIVKPILKSFSKRIDPSRYNGATLIGLNGIVIKSHGAARAHAFAHAIEEAIIEVENNVPERIGNKVEQLLKLSSSQRGE